MTKVIFIFLIGAALFLCVTPQPLRNDILQERPSGHVESTAIAIVFLISVVVTLSYCVCCSSKNVKDAGQQNGISAHHDSSNNFSSSANCSEFTIFPPSSAIITQPSNYSDDKVTFEPLPEILPQKSHDHPSDLLQLAKFNSSLHKGLGDWFSESVSDYFPRNKLQYHQELGSCWFGQVVLGEAKGIIEKEAATKVVVKILKQDAAPNEYVNFLQEIRPFRDLNHPNVIKLLGYCLETNPYLFIMEHCPMDLKAYLISHCDEAEFLLQSGYVLHIACDIIAGLQHMHDHDFVHMDLAARNCFITLDNRVKLGGYGTSLQTYKEEYYCQGNAALPLRWCDPDSVTCAVNLIETREVTKAANVWSFGVVLWEVLEFGKLPYFELTDEEVLQKVILERSCRLKAPSTPCIHSDRMYEIMQMCWSPAGTRCSIHRIAALINHLYDNKDLISNPAAFETRWTSLQPHSSEQNLLASTDSTMPKVVLKLKSEFTQNAQALAPYEHSSITTGNTSPSRDSVSLSTGMEFSSISPSMQNLRGSLDDLNPFQLSVESVSSEYMPSHNVSLCNVEQPKNVSPSKDILSDPVAAPVSLNEPVSQSFEMTECKSSSCHNTQSVLGGQTSHAQELPETQEDKKKKEISNICSNNDLSGNCKEFERDALLDNILPMPVSEKRNEEIEMFTSKEKCNCDMTCLETNMLERRCECVCSFNLSAKSLASKHISQSNSNTINISSECEKKENMDCLDKVERKDSENIFSSNNLDKTATNLEDIGFVDDKEISGCECKNSTTEYLQSTKLMCKNCIALKGEATCTHVNENKKSEIISDATLLGEPTVLCDVDNYNTSVPGRMILSDNGAAVDKFRKLSHDETIFVLTDQSTFEDSSNNKMEKAEVELLQCHHSAPSLSDDVIYNQPTTKNVLLSGEMAYSDNSMECEIEPEGSILKKSDASLSNGSLHGSQAYNTDDENPNRQNVFKINDDTNEEVEIFSKSKNPNHISSLMSTNYVEEGENCLFSEFTNETIEESCDPLVFQHASSQNEKTEDSFGCYYYKKKDEDSGKRPASLKCQSAEPVILVTECSTSPGSQSGDEYQLEDISSVLKEDAQTDINYSVACSSSIQHHTLFLDDSEKMPEPVGAYSSGEAGPSEWSSDRTHTYSSYWTERIPVSGTASKNKEEASCKSLSDVVTLEDLDTGCEKDIIACYEPYQDPFETDEVLSVDTETNVAVLLDSHHSVIGFVPSKVDIFAGNREIEDEVLSSSEIQSNMSDVDNNAQIYVNGYKSSESASPRSLCSTSTDFSVNADQRSETSVDSDLVPDLSISHSECKASSESNSKSSTERDQETMPKQHYINNINLDFKILDISSEDSNPENNTDYAMSSRENNAVETNSPMLCHVEDVVSPGRDAYTPDFDSDTDDTSSTGTTCTSTSGSFECLYKSGKAMPSESKDVDQDENQSNSPVQVFSVTWDRNATPTKSSMKSPEKKGGQMKKSVSFQEEDPPLFSYPPESEGSDDESRGLDYPANFLWNVDYSVYTDWDFQSSLDLEEIPEDIVEVEDPEEDDEYLTFRYKSLPLRPLQVYTFTDITDDDDESASLRTNLSEIDTTEESANLKGIYLEAKSDEDDNSPSPSPSPSNSVPNEVCQEVIEIYPTFDDLSDMLETKENGEELPRKNIDTVSDSHGFDNVTGNAGLKEGYYTEFAKSDSSLSMEHNALSKDTIVDSENNLSYNAPLQYSHEINSSEQHTETLTDSSMLNSTDAVSKEDPSTFFHKTDCSHELYADIYSNRNSANFQQKDSCFKEINDNIGKIQKLEDKDAAVGDYLSQSSEKENSHTETNKYIYSADDEMCCGQNNNVQSELPSELNSSDQNDDDCHSLVDISLNIHGSSTEGDNKAPSLHSSNVLDLNVKYAEVNKNIKEYENEKSRKNTNRPKNLPPSAAQPFVQHCKANFNEPQSIFAATYIGDDNSSGVLCLSKDDGKYSFVDKLDNSNVACGINTTQTYYSLNSNEIDIPVMNAGYQECTSSILYDEDVAEGKDTSESSLSSKSTEDSSEKDSAISSGGEFSPAYSPGVLQESRDNVWDFQHTSTDDNSEKSAAVETVKDDNENSSAVPVDADTSALLPAIVVSDSDNVNFTIHSSSVLHTYNNFRYEHNGNIPTDVAANLATAACDKNDNIVQE